MLRDRPAFFWAALAMLLFLGAMLVPTEWTRAVGSLLDPTANPEITAFSPSIARTDRSLRSGRPPEVSAERLEQLTPYLKARRLSRLGPMTEPDVEQAVEMFEEMKAQTGPDMDPGARRSLTNHYIDEILDAFPRLRQTTSPADIRRMLDRLDQQLEEAAPAASD